MDSIPIIIGKKKYKIKPINKLTTKEFIEFSKLETPDHIKYIAWQTGLEFKDAFFAVTSKTVEKAIGTAPDITKLPVPKWVDKTKLIDTVGQRHQVESSGLSGYELLIYCLAVSQARSNNSDEVEALRVKYEDMPFIEIMPAGFFFFKNFNNGKKKGLRSLNLLRCLIMIRNLRKRLGLRS